MCDKKDAFAAFVLGGIVGAVIGLLYAPKAGKETRKGLRRMGRDFADTIDDLREDVRDTGHKIYEEGRNTILSGKDKISEAFEAGKKAFEKYKDED